MNIIPKSVMRGLLKRLTAEAYKIALVESPGKYSADSETFSGLDEVTGEGYEAGGKLLSGATVTGDTIACLDFASPVKWQNATITAAGAIIYNEATAAILYIIDFAGNVSSVNDTFTVTLPPPGESTSLIRIA